MSFLNIPDDFGNIVFNGGGGVPVEDHTNPGWGPKPGNDDYSPRPEFKPGEMFGSLTKYLPLLGLFFIAWYFIKRKK